MHLYPSATKRRPEPPPQPIWRSSPRWRRTSWTWRSTPNGYPTPAATGDAGRPGSRPSIPRASCWQPPLTTSGRWWPCACPPSPGAARRPPRADRAATPSWRCSTPTSSSRTGRRTGGSHPALPQHFAAEPPSIAPHNNPAPPHSATSITFRTHFINEPRERSAPQSPGD